MTASARSTAAPAALASNRLGVPQVICFALSGVAPLTIVAGVITTACAVTGLASVPAAFYLAAVVLAVFSVGFVAMSRHIRNAGAFYAYIARGLGRAAGVGAAGVALVACNLLQVGLYGAFGAGFIGEKTGLYWSWWVWALIAWAVAGLLGCSG
jgi:amino acid transporter